MVKVSKMLKPAMLTLVIGLLLIQPMNISAQTASGAKQVWYQAKEASRAAQEALRKANLDYAASKTEANNQKVIDSGKAALKAALDEAEAWLNWVELEVKENPEVPADLKDVIRQDVASNLAKIVVLRGEVDAVQNRIQLATVFLKMVGKYLEVVSDVARNTGLVWVHMADSYASTVEEYEAELRGKAVGSTNEKEILAKLDEAKGGLAKARTNIDSAEAEYLQVKFPGNPILRFSNGNQYLRIARNSLLAAHSSLRQAYRLLMGGG
jgi:hypothetical protein